MNIEIQKVPRINTNDDEVEVLHWYAEDGQWLDKGADLVDVGTSKATFTIQAEHAGFVEHLIAPGKMVPVAADLAAFNAQKIEEEQNEEEVHPFFPTPGNPPLPVILSEAKDPQVSEAVPTSGVTRFSNAAQSYLKEKNLNPTDFTGQGLITKRHLSGSTPAPIPAPPTVNYNAFSRAKNLEISQLKKGLADGLTSSLTLYFQSEPLRARLHAEDLFGGLPLPVILFELVKLIQESPLFNASLDESGVHHHEKVSLGLAIDLGQGLKVATRPESEAGFPHHWYEWILGVVDRYAQGKMSAEDLAPSTVTVTDLSTQSILHFEPLINGNQSTIFGIGGDSEAPGYPMSLTCVFDHRILTGKMVADFLQTLKKRIQSFGAKAKPTPAPTLTSSSCDFCLIPAAEYYAKFKKAALLQVYVRADGALGCVCHACAAGF